MKLLQKLYTETLSYNPAAFIYVLSQIAVCFQQQIRICFTEFFKHLTFKMSVKILAESEASWERTLVYQTVYENFVVLVQQRKQDDVWHVYHHCLLPKLLINAIAALPEKTDPSESTIITSGGHLPATVLPAFQDCNMDTLPDEIKRIFYRYDCDCVPLFENQLGAYQVCDDLGNLWGIKTSPSSPDSETTLASLPTTPAVDPSPAVTPTPSPSLFAGIHNNNNNSPNNFDSFDT